MVVPETDRAPYERDADVQLMLRAKDGDDAAFSELVTTYEKQVLCTLRRQVRDEHTAQDLAQEVFLRAYGARGRYQPTAKFTTWLFRIASNLASNSRRNHRRRREVPLALWESGQLSSSPGRLPAAQSPTPRPERRLETTELQFAVRAALDRLGERQRQAVVLQKYEDKSCVEIGVAMHLTPVAVKSLLSRAREKLREELGPELLAKHSAW